MEQRLLGKAAIVTGGDTGIGKAIAVSLAKEGATVVLAATSRDKLARAADEIAAFGAKAHIFQMDLRDEQSIKNLVAFTADTLGRLDILVNNAGVTTSAALEETSTQDWDMCMAVNARGPFILCRQALALLKKAPQGYIINISSVVGVKGYARQIAYTASKHAVRGMTLAMAEELRGSNIRVHVICPGGVDTDMVRTVRPDIPHDELIKPGEIAELVKYLVTHKGNAVIDELRIRRASAAPWFS